MHIVVVWNGSYVDHIDFRGVPNVLPARAHFNRIITGTDDKVRLFDQWQQVGVGQWGQARATKGKRVIFGQQSLCFICRDDRDGETFCHFDQCGGCIFVDGIQTCDDDGTVGCA